MMKAHRHFTAKQRKKAKADFKKYKSKKHTQWLAGREKIITAIATTKFTPVYSLKVTLQAQ